MQNEPSIVIKDLNFYHSGNHTLKDINVAFPKNRITAIIGPSGCGKTTLLKCLNRLYESDEDVRITGQIFIDGKDILNEETDVTELRKKMGFLSQKPYPLPMSIYDNVAFGPRIHGTKKRKELDEIVEHYLKEATLWNEVKDRLHYPASKLSIGQQQRLCLARGLAVQPDFIIGDEPTSALDPQSSSHIEQKFMELKKDYTIIVVTHILRQAKRIGDYIIYMHSGEIIEHGEAVDIINNPKKQKTIEYMQGIIN